MNEVTVIWFAPTGDMNYGVRYAVNLTTEQGERTLRVFSDNAAAMRYAETVAERENAEIIYA